MSEKKDLQSFVVYASFLEAADDLNFNLTEYGDFFVRLANYCLNGIDEKSENPRVNALLAIAKPNVKAAADRWVKSSGNGKYGELGKEFGKLGGRPRTGETAEEAYQRRKKELEEQEKTPENPLNTNTNNNTNTTINTNVKLNITETKDKDRVEVPSSFYKEGDYSTGVDNQMVSSWTFNKKVEHISTIYNEIIRIPKEEMTNPTRFDNFADASNEILDNYSKEVLSCFAALYLGENGEAATRKLIEIAAPAGEAAFDRTITDLLTYAARYCADDTPVS